MLFICSHWMQLKTVIIITKTMAVVNYKQLSMKENWDIFAWCFMNCFLKCFCVRIWRGDNTTDRLQRKAKRKQRNSEIHWIIHEVGNLCLAEWFVFKFFLSDLFRVKCLNHNALSAIIPMSIWKLRGNFWLVTLSDWKKKTNSILQFHLNYQLWSLHIPMKVWFVLLPFHYECLIIFIVLFNKAHSDTIQRFFIFKEETVMNMLYFWEIFDLNSEIFFPNNTDEWVLLLSKYLTFQLSIYDTSIK